MSTHRAIRTAVLIGTVWLVSGGCPEGESLLAGFNDPPRVRITTPENGDEFRSGQTVVFEGTVVDPDGGCPGPLSRACKLTGNALVWTSDVEGTLGKGESVSKTSLSSGPHTITLTATDPDGATGTASVTITIVTQEVPLSISFEDNFAVGDQWSAHVVSSGGTVTHSATNRATGGQGDNAGFREMEHVIDGVGSLHLFHRYEGGTYTPSDPDGGAIATIDFSAYRIVVDPQIQGGAVAGGFALEQGGTVYRAALEAFTNLDWEAEIRGGLTAADFAAPDGSHPDFSASGSQMWFGYARANSSPNAGSMMRKHGIDDWKVEIHRQP